MKLIEPENTAQLCDVIRDAYDKQTRLRILGGGTRKNLGKPVLADGVVSTQKLCGIIEYDPGSLYLVARSGTALDEVTATLKTANQRLAFEPPDYRAVLHTTGQSTIGAMVACGLSGSRRLQVGGVRDHLLGVEFINGCGERIKSGGRVMKNVTGLDLAKLMCGAYGTLGVLTKVTLKTLPIPSHKQTLVISGLDIKGAVDLFTAVLKTPYELTGAAYCNKTAYLRVEGTQLQVKNRVAALRSLAGAAQIKVLCNDDLHWETLRDLHFFAKDESPLWRLSIKPSDATALSAKLQTKFDAKIALDWAGGLIWAQIPSDASLHPLLARYDGHATLIRGDEALRAKGVFQPVDPILERLNKNLRLQFDAKQILNSGLMG